MAAHKAILRAIERGDEDRASKKTRAHLMQTQSYPLSSDRDLVVQIAPPGALSNLF
jgi:DNA-binding GntR family transcriptional regulator